MPTPADWDNVNLDGYEADSFLIDHLTFSQLLIEIECNEKTITKEAITAHFEKRLNGITEEAREIFAANLDNITSHAKKSRAV